jgi:multiple sugar transport system ATP-binding protein
VAQFIGTPQMNIISAAVVPQLHSACGALLPADGSIGPRPEHVALKPSGEGMLKGRVDLVEALGAETLIYVSTSEMGIELTSRQSQRTHLRPGDEVGVTLDLDAAHLFDGKGRITRVGAAAQ